MPKTRQQKQQAVTQYVDHLKKAKGLVFANFEGLKVKDIEALRKLCRQAGIDYVVAKKTLMTLALKEAGISEVNPKDLNKSVASVFGYDDEVAAAKVIGDFAKTHEALKPIGGLLENKFIDQAKVIALSKLPSKKELLAQLVGSMQAPVAGFVGVLAATLRGLVLALSAIKESKSTQQ